MSEPIESTLPPAWIAADHYSAEWEPLPPKARTAYRISSMLGTGIPAAIAAGLAGYTQFDRGVWVVALVVLGWLLLVAAAFCHGSIRYRRTRYLLDGDGLRIRRGLWWRKETLVPRTRVQHLDLERGPLERWLGLSTLVVHTAGTRMNSVNLAGVGEARGRELRNDLIDRDAGDDDAV